MALLKFSTYDLGNSAEFKEFGEVKADFLSLISSGYGNKYFGDEVYNEKIAKKDLVVIFASINNKFIGCLTIKSHEKLSALAVLKEYRREGVGTELIVYSHTLFDFLYAEVPVTSLHMHSLFKKINYKVFFDKVVIEVLLSKQNDNVIFIDESTEYLSYIHAKEKHEIDRKREYMMFYHKAPNSSPYPFQNKISL